MIAAPARRLVTVTGRSPGLAALLSALLPGLGQMYTGHWGRGLAMLAVPFAAAASLAGILLFGGPLASVVVQRAHLFALLVVGGLFAYHLVVVAEAFTGPLRSLRGRHSVDYALLTAIVLGLIVAYHGA